MVSQGFRYVCKYIYNLMYKYKHNDLTEHNQGQFPRNSFMLTIIKRKFNHIKWLF